MKRSEMIDLIYGFIDSTELGAGRYMEKRDCGVLLDLMEEAGMLPPIEPGRTESDLDLGIPEWEEE